MTSTLSLHYELRLPKQSTAKPPLLVLLHGVGSNEKDLLHFANSFDERFLVVSARAPITLGHNAYGWFHVDFSTGEPVIVAEEAESSRKILKQFIKELTEQYQIDKTQIYLLGFSQGAIMSASLALTEPELVKGIVMLSGRILPEIKPLIASPEKLKHLEVFLSHGVHDTKLPLFHAEQSKALLSHLSVGLEYRTYNMGHTITSESLSDARSWLSSKLRKETL